MVRLMAVAITTLMHSPLTPLGGMHVGQAYEVCALTKVANGFKEETHKWAVWHRYSEFKTLDQ